MYLLKRTNKSNLQDKSSLGDAPLPTLIDRVSYKKGGLFDTFDTEEQEEEGLLHQSWETESGDTYINK